MISKKPNTNTAFLTSSSLRKLPPRNSNALAPGVIDAGPHLSHTVLLYNQGHSYLALSYPSNTTLSIIVKDSQWKSFDIGG
jgi:hypothetical protein